MPEAQGQTISWDVITHMHKERTADWYWGLGVITFVAAAISIWLGNLLFALILVIGAGSIGALLARGPREHGVRIDSRGVAIDGTLYPFKSLKSFWVDRHPEDPRLYLMTSGIMSPHVTLPLESIAQAGQVHSMLKRVVEEKEQEPHFGEYLAELFGL
ncbi:MAG: hypothetical protein KGH79_01800 [Patescibacteria group bacterium]|nr:hypothetical protein [Patescibacteria group bacterium]